MLAVEKWAQNKPQIIALIAPQMATFTRELPHIFRNLKSHRIDKIKCDLPDLPSWYALYRNHNQYCDPFKKMLLESSALVQHVASFEATANAVIHDDKVTGCDHDKNHIADFSKRLLELSFDDIRSDFDNNIADQNISTSQEDFVAKHNMELSFVFMIFLPCFFLYKLTPGRLYHKARIGEVSAIDKLLRLDPLMLHDPAIGKQIQKIRLYGRTTTYQNLIEAPLKPLKFKPTPGKIKASMATLISMIAASIHHPLTSTEIRKLFDAVAQDADKRDQDNSLPSSDEAFLKSIQRKRASWQSLVQPDNKKCK